MKNYEYDVSLLVPYAEDWPHLYFTLNQAAALLVASKLTHEIIVVLNNSSEQALEDALKLTTAVDFASFHNVRLFVEDVPSNARAANLAAKYARGRYLFFTDSHVVMHPNIFEECISVMEAEEKAGLVHSPVTWTGVPYEKDGSLSMSKRCFCYRYREFDATKEWYLTRHFHGTYSHQYKHADRPFKIAGCGHGFFALRHDVYEHIGCYHEGQIAYGGREPYLTFKAWLFGYENYSVPTTNHVHYNGRRLYRWHNDWWMHNCMQQAYCIGGEKWLNIIYTNFCKKPGVKKHVMERLRQEAVTSSTRQRAFVLKNQIMDFDELWTKFEKEGIIY